MKELAERMVAALEEVESLKGEINSLDDKSLIELVEKSWMFLYYIDRDNQTGGVCMAAMMQDARALKYVKIPERAMRKIDLEKREKALCEWEDYIYIKKQEEARKEDDKKRKKWIDEEEREEFLDR